jgi:hypothetical protein
MAAEGFFSRWSRRKAGQDQPAAPVAEQPASSPPAEQPVAEQASPQLTMEDVAQLKPDSDYSPFIARGVDENVKRSAMKKLFSDPHFNVMDGLDVYIEDYNKFEPISPQMLASLNHAKALLDPLSQLEKTPIPLAENKSEPDQAPMEDDQQAAVEATDHSEAAAPQASEVADVPAADEKPLPAPGQEDDAADSTRFSQDRP